MNKIKTSEPKTLWKLRCTLGEGTLWVGEHNSIYFVDIKKKKICSFNIKNKKKKIFKVNKEIGFMEIPKLIEIAMDNHDWTEDPSIDDILSLEDWTTNFVKSFSSKYIK